MSSDSWFTGHDSPVTTPTESPEWNLGPYERAAIPGEGWDQLCAEDLGWGMWVRCERHEGDLVLHY